MNSIQLPLFLPELPIPVFDSPFPSTRYQGSKRTLVEWIWGNVAHLPFDTVLDVFGGTGVVSHMFKRAGKQVIYNDLLAFNWNIGLALIENRSELISDRDVDLILSVGHSLQYPDFIENTFRNIYFTDDENRWLDRTIYNIDHLLKSRYQQALARFALFQACLIKRPYNLFHRANLYMRTAQVERSFGNKTTWDTPFETHFRAFVAQANRAVFDNSRNNQAICTDALKTPVGSDLVYIDSPYLNARGTGVDYRNFYHFLEGLVDYEGWGARIDYRSKHRRLRPEKSGWNSAATITDCFEQLIERHRDSILIISYRDDGIPSKEQLRLLLLRVKSRVEEAVHVKQYTLARKQSHELLLIAL